MVEQWGNDLGTAFPQQRDINFPIAFPKACYSVTVAAYPRNSTSYSHGVFSFTTKLFKYNGTVGGNYKENSCSWIAIGK